MRSRFIALTFIWGASFLFIKLGLQSFAPLQVAFGRMLFGALTLLGVVLARRERLPREPRIWAHLALAAVLANALPFTLFAIAEQQVSSSLASIGNATVPLFTLLFALLLLPNERPTLLRALGLAVGFAGVVVVLGIWRGAAQRRDLWGLSIILAACASYGLSGVQMRRNLSHTHYSSLALACGQLLVGALILALFLPFTDRPAHVSARSLSAVMALGALGTGTAYVLMYGVLRIAGATVSSTVTYFIPIALGVLVLGERLQWNAPLGAVIIMLGALLSRSGPRGQAMQPAPIAEVPKAAQL